MSWTFEGEMRSKTYRREGGLHYIFDCRNFWITDDEGSAADRIKAASVKLSLHDLKSGSNQMLCRDWNPDEILKDYQGSFSGSQASWLTFSRNSDTIYVYVVAERVQIERIFDNLEAGLFAGSVHLHLNFDDVGFAAHEGNAKSRFPTTRSFVNGDTVLAEGGVELGFMRPKKLPNQ